MSINETNTRTIYVHLQAKNQTMKTSDLINTLSIAKIYDVDIYPRESKIKTTKGIRIIDDGSHGGTHWVAF